MEYEITSKCNKGFNLKKMKVKHNNSLSKEQFEMLAEIFHKIFTINPEERISINDLKNYRLFQGEKMTLTCPSTESESDE